ncbi:uncharacterized protein LOC117649327 [Thrips palmi]|uniref:Uncharacterized protein LOC117649327 n=1 Tax=Thrips palmi TaxID=161013 RepID=A0A6P8ZRS9_THRPL|nr:uncharacterized protein LOC117649327 [Thrips palmi]
MAPTTEALGHDGGTGWLGADSAVKEHQRPPIYNPEDYAQSLRKFGRRTPAPGGTGPGGASPGINGASTPGASPPGGGRLDSKCNKSTLGSSKSASCAALPTLGGPQGPLSSASAMSTAGSHRGSARGSTENLRPQQAAPHGAPQQQQMQQMEPEMSLRQFDSVGELLNKLKADLRLAFPSFVQEFVDSAVDGVSLLLELLRTVQLQQQGGGGAGGGVASQRQALLQENACLQCLHGCLRCPDAPRRLAVSSAGLFTLAVSTMSSVNKSRVLALQLLTKTCEGCPEGHGAVSEALSTMRLRFGEPVRFRFLAGVLSSAGGQSDLLLAGLRFLNAFLRSAPGPQQRVYIQAELGQAGFQPSALRDTLPASTAGSAEVQDEFDAWQRQQVDVAALTQRCQQAENRATQLQDQLSQLQRRLQVLSLEQTLKGSKSKDDDLDKDLDKDDSRSTPAEDEGISSSDQDRSLSPDAGDREPMVYEVVLKVADGHNGLNGVNGIGHNNQRPAPRTAPRTAPRASKLPQQQDEDDEEEATIEEVMEEFQNIINDAETEVYANNQVNRTSAASDRESTKNVYVNGDTLTARIQVPYPQDNNRAPAKTGRLRLEALFQNAPPAKPQPQQQQQSQQQQQAPQPTQRLQLPQRLAVPHDDDDQLQLQQHGESEIVPSALLPQPPRRAKSLVHLCAPSKDYVNLCNSSPFFDDADSFSNMSGDGDNSDSLLSASREPLGLGLGMGLSLDGGSAASLTRDKNLRNAADSAAGGGPASSGASRTSRGYRSIAMIMPDEDCRDCDKEDDVIKPVEVSVYQGMQGIPDILRCSKQTSRQATRQAASPSPSQGPRDAVDPATVRNGSNYQPAGGATTLAKPTPSTATTASATSTPVPPVKSPRTGSSFDGLFYVSDTPKTPAKPSNGKPPAVAPKKKSARSSASSAASTERSDSQRSGSQRQSDGSAALRRQVSKAKSLERIDESHGVNGMVDIVVSQKQQQRLAPDGVFQAREWSVEWGQGVGQGRLPAAGRLPVPGGGCGAANPAGPVVIVSRSTSVRHQQRQQFQPPPRPPTGVGRRTPPEGAMTSHAVQAHPLFLPVSSRVSAFEKGDPRHAMPAMGPAPPGPVSASFVIKRGHTNAGLYSGHHVLRDSHGPGHGPAHGPGVNMAKIVTTAPVPGLPGLGHPVDFARGIHVNLAVPGGKLTDLPSGLY